MRARITGNIIGYTWYGHKEVYPLFAEVDELPRTLDALKKFNNLNFTGIIGAMIHVYPYTTISGVVYRSVEPVETYRLGKYNDNKDIDSLLSTINI